MTAMSGTHDVSAREEARLRLVEALRRRRDELVDAGVRAIRDDIPGYARIGEDATLLADLRAHVDEHHVAFVRCLTESRLPEPADLRFVRPHAIKRVGRVPLASFIHAFRSYQLVLWAAVTEETVDDATRAAALAIAGVLMRYMNDAATEAAEVYLEAERLTHAHGERVRRDLVEDLIGGQLPAPGPKLDAARDAGIQVDATCVLLLARSLSGAEASVMRAIASSLANASAGAVRPLTVVRQEEILVILPAERIDYSRLAAALSGVCETSNADGVRLAVAVSTEQDGLAGVPVAYREACEAIERLTPEGGSLVLPTMRAFDSLTMFGRDTARRLVTPRVRAFVRDDIAGGGQLASTLLAYVASDLNATVAAERLFLHVNTARYRLRKIEERTGSDLHSLADVLELTVALSLEGYRPS
jgi:sugar diacid utilization regulator